MSVLIIGLVLAVLILVHELGHLIAAKLSGVGVDRFSLGFGPAVVKWKWRETTYILSLIPLGGYVKLKGEDFEPGGFYSQSLAAKLKVSLAGPVANLLLGILLFCLIFLAYGQGTIPARVRVEPGSWAESQGLHTGDLVTRVDKTPIRDYESLIRRLDLAGDSAQVELDRSGERVRLWVVVDSLGLTPLLPPVIDQVKRGGPADRSGLAPGDLIVELSGEPVDDWSSVVERVQAAAGETLEIGWRRDDSLISALVVPDSVSRRPHGVVGQIGVTVRLPRYRFGPGSALLKATGYGARVVGQAFLLLYQILVGKLSRELLGGPILMAQLSLESARWGLENFLSLLALLSLNLFVINILPIPVLDGGRVLIFLIEAVRRRSLSRRGWNLALQIGWVMVLGLIIFATFNDLMRLLGR